MARARLKRIARLVRELAPLLPVEVRAAIVAGLELEIPSSPVLPRRRPPASGRVLPAPASRAIVPTETARARARRALRRLGWSAR